MLAARLVSSFILLLCLSSQAWATTWYIRSDGTTYGTTSTTCNGQTDAAYSAGNGPNCAVKDRYQIFSWNGGGTMRVQGGDTVIFSKASDQIPEGIDRSAVQSGCSTSSPYDCWINRVPDGTDGAHTKIYGYGYNTGCDPSTRVQLYGRQAVGQVLNLQNSDYVDVECLEITDHRACLQGIGGTTCSQSYPSDVGDWAKKGVWLTGATNITFRNVDIHGLGDKCIHGAGTNITFDHVNMDACGWAGWDWDDTAVGGTGRLAGTMTVDYAKVRFNGCLEAYPRSSSFSNSDYSGCVDQNSSGYGEGWGGSVPNSTVTFNITNSEWSWNVQDGLDLLYFPSNYLVLNMDKTIFEGNSGNQLKAATGQVVITNSLFVANCNYHATTSKTYGSFTSCRANGTPIVISPWTGADMLIENSTFYTGTTSSGSPAIEILDIGVNNPDGSETYTYRNNIYMSHNGTWGVYYCDLGGAAGTACSASPGTTTQYSFMDDFQSSQCLTGTGNVCNSAPNFAGTFAVGNDSNTTNFYLTSSSPMKGAGTTGLSWWNDSNDINNYPQNSPVDMGFAQYGTISTLLGNGETCAQNDDCSSGVCTNYLCVGGGGGSGSATSITGMTINGWQY